jgi:hypothetical protein
MKTANACIAAALVLASAGAAAADTADDIARGRYMVLAGRCNNFGAAGQPVPAFVPADREPAPPYEVRRLVR